MLPLKLRLLHCMITWDNSYSNFEKYEWIITERKRWKFLIHAIKLILLLENQMLKKLINVTQQNVGLYQLYCDL